jgi:pyrrolidone-carboxylate peptidase
MFIGILVITPIISLDFDSFDQSLEKRPAIMLTGYWNPTGQMIAPFSTDPYLNPGGWKGENWEGRGYDIYSFFPTPGRYNGTFEVDYQNTWNDFWNITSELRPIAIISFGAGGGPWEIEYISINLGHWIPDKKPPYQPTPCPPDDSVPENYVRYSTLPVQEIANAINNQTDIYAWVDWDGSPGAFLCGYIAYLGMWYQSIHSETHDPCKAAGFIHVDPELNVKDCMEATNITLRETIKYLSKINNPPEAPKIDGPTNGTAGKEYNYTFSARDPEGHDIYYCIDWGVGEEICIGPLASGEKLTLAHVWHKQGTYTIRAKARDVFGSESEWSTLEVSMPKFFFILFIKGGRK